MRRQSSLLFCSFFFNDTATTEIYTLSLHDALPILGEPHDVPGHVLYFQRLVMFAERAPEAKGAARDAVADFLDRKSTRLNSSHSQISYAAFCFKKKNS